MAIISFLNFRMQNAKNVAFCYALVFQKFFKEINVSGRAKGGFGKESPLSRWGSRGITPPSQKIFKFFDAISSILVQFW